MPQYEKKFESQTAAAVESSSAAVADPRDDDANRSPDFNGFGDNAEGDGVAPEFSGVLNVTEGNPEATTDDSGFAGNTDGNADVSDEGVEDMHVEEEDPLVPLVKQEQQMQMLAITDVVGSGSAGEEGEMTEHGIQMVETPGQEFII